MNKKRGFDVSTGMEEEILELYLLPF